MKLENGIDIVLQESQYKSQSNTINPMYNLTIYKSYFKNTPKEAIDDIVKDLKQVIYELENINYN